MIDLAPMIDNTKSLLRYEVYIFAIWNNIFMW